MPLRDNEHIITKDNRIIERGTEQTDYLFKIKDGLYIEAENVNEALERLHGARSRARSRSPLYNTLNEAVQALEAEYHEGSPKTTRERIRDLIVESGEDTEK